LLASAGNAWRGSSRNPSRWLLLAAVPTLVDALAASIFGAGVDNLPRAVLALPAGTAFGLFLGAGVRALARQHARGGLRGLLREEA
jgi:hypothetical protein